jgi:hypothetical protein
MKKSSLFVPIVTFAAGLLAGLTWRSTQTDALAQPNPPPAHPKERVTRRPATSHAFDQERAHLRARITELERRLADEQARQQETPPPPVPAPETRATGREPFQERMARLAKEDPARYAEITNRFAMIRKSRLEHAQSRIDFLSTIDTASMSTEARATHEALQDLIEKREELEGRLHDPELSDDERRRLFLDMRETDRSLQKLNQEERRNLLTQMAVELGFNDDTARDITATIHDIVNATENHRHRPGRRHIR